MARAITESVWRNDRPVAPELHIDAYRGQPIDISLLDYLVQGARDIVQPQWTEEEKKEKLAEGKVAHVETIEQKGARRGWACSYFNISRPGFGRLSRSIYADGFRYTSLPNYVGEDCFSYVINNSFQNSLPGKIIINVQNFMEGRIIIEEDVTKRTSSSRALRYVAQWYIPPEFGTFSHVTMAWYEHSPTRFMQDGQTKVRMEKKELQRTVLTSSSLSSSGFQYVRQNYKWPADGSFHTTTWPNTAVDGLIDEKTGAPYQQPAGPWPVSVEISFRRQKTESYRTAIYVNNSRFPTYVTRYRTRWEYTETIEVDVRTLYGNGWWRDGRIQNVHDPSFSAAEPGTFEPDIEEPDMDDS